MTFILEFQKSSITQKYWIFEIKQDHFMHFLTSILDIHFPTYQDYSDEPTKICRF
jgi:hypothetical protein